MALTGLGSLKTHLGVPDSDTSQDAFLAQLLAAAEAAFKRLVDRDIEATDYVDFYGGRFTQTLLLNEYPVVSVSTVHVDQTGAWGQAPDAFPAGSLLTAGVDYALARDGRNGLAETGRLLRIGSVWPGRFVRPANLLSYRQMPGLGNIRVAFRAGFEVVPPEIPLCLWQVCAELRARRASGMVMASESFDGASLGFLQQQAADLLMLPGSRQEVVSRYRRRAPRFSAYS